MVYIVTGDQIFEKGLRLCGFTSRQFEKSSREASLQRFRHLYGSNPIVYAQIWEDLQNTGIPVARINNVTAIDLVYFFMALHFLKCYITEAHLAATFQLCERTAARKWCWAYAVKIQALKHEKVCSRVILKNITVFAMIWDHCY